MESGSSRTPDRRRGLLGLTRGLARELTPQGITVNAIVPGVIDSDFHGEDRQQAIDAAIGKIPAGRVGQLAASYISGQVIHVNGGWLFGS